METSPPEKRKISVAQCEPRIEGFACISKDDLAKHLLNEREQDQFNAEFTIKCLRKNNDR